jgi:hypothetical protein
MSERLIIIGGGFNGQLLHTVFHRARVFDWRPSPPDLTAQPRQFGPQYLWEPVDGLACSPFVVTTHVDGRPATDDAVRAYKRKVDKEQDAGDWRAQFQTTMQGWSVALPPSRVEYGRRIASIDRVSRKLIMSNHEEVFYDILISTIPLYSLLSLAGLPEPDTKLTFRPIYVSSSPCADAMLSDGMYVNYISDPATPIYRETQRDAALHRESLHATDGVTIKITPGKIYGHFAVPMLQNTLRAYGIHTFGRFASWHPDELAHETFRQALSFKVFYGIR